MTEPVPSVIDTRPRRRGSMLPAWTCLTLAVLALAAELLVVSRFEHRDCAIGAALLAWAALGLFAVLTPVATLVQQLRGGPGSRRVGQAVALYVVGGVLILSTLVMALPIVFADSC